ncbi:putative RNA polymerase II transcription factor B subunit [Paramyrothecium foliicola]|nr:putative RNA polymerase II transcription factor B subunit [Paramyrothecium foliicola]
MPRAIRGKCTEFTVLNTLFDTNLVADASARLPHDAGVLIECDPSIKSIIVNIDSANHDFIIEDLDEERVVVKENMVALLKQKLEDRLKENLPPVDESGSE